MPRRLRLMKLSALSQLASAYCKETLLVTHEKLTTCDTRETMTPFLGRETKGASQFSRRFQGEKREESLGAYAQGNGSCWLIPGGNWTQTRARKQTVM